VPARTMMFMGVEVEGEGERGGIGATPLALGLHPAQCAQLFADCGFEFRSLDFNNVYRTNAEAFRTFHAISPSPSPR
jgi:hypothetical protein